MTGLRYVYAVCRPFGAALQSQLTGLGGDPPRLLTHHGLIAVVSHVPEQDFAEKPLRAHAEDPDWQAATTRAHQSVIDALTAVTTPLPLRPGTVFRDDSGVRTMMEAHEDYFRRTLDRLDGRVEWGVEVYAETESFASRLHETLSSYAEDSRLHIARNSALSGVAGRNVLDAAYLVPRSDSEEFVELVDRAKEAAAPGTRVELTGPWAAYSFTGHLPPVPATPASGRGSAAHQESQ
ncbi:GvpL/GvpF family gas vesicle protein [Streptomyces fulvoviolaceus]|uniref:GvpL/GvpF family gas vesicle protein n=1 Tax=Streptomyces fulvoviolaceus TaxID=285535 RepID=UPI0007C5BF31|nr:GvpL/GvpF family gas vesicle protein [Streptomyces fulvoviolaceus]MCT9084158.1 GvpL/GvpF family gas vesicle protein [Streptomyces fulvoviolaceus]